MDINAVIDGIIERKEQVGMTNQQISDASGVPRTTVNRILQKQTPNPSVKTLADIAVAVGYDISPVQPAVLQDHTKDAYITYLQEALEAERKLRDKEKAELRAHYNMLLAEKNRWIRYSFFALIILIVFIVSWLIVDILHPSAGWIQREISRYTDGPLGDAMMAMMKWFGY